MELSGRLQETKEWPSRGSSKYWTIAACIGALVTILAFHQFWNSNTLEAVPKNAHNEVIIKTGRRYSTRLKREYLKNNKKLQGRQHCKPRSKFVDL